MFIATQGSGQGARAQAEAAQAQAQAQADQLQQQIQQTVQQAIQQAEKAAQASGGKGMSDEAKQQLKEEIRAAIDAAREASSEGRGPRIVFGDGNGPNGAFISVPNGTDGLIPPQIPEMLGILGFTLVCCVVGLPVARAFGRWLDRRGNTQPVNREVTARLEAIEQAVESVAVEVERISEGQRFTTRMLSERTHEPAQDFAANRERVPVDAAGAPANARRG